MLTGPAALIGAATLILGLFVSGIPIFLCFLALNLIGIWALLGAPAFPMLINSMFATTTNGQLTAIPLFVLMGEILFRSGATERIFEAVDRFIGRLKGRQYILAGALSAIFGALSGSNMAVAAMMARTVFPGMIARGYDRKLSIGMILGGASLAPVIPPSVLVIIIATLANVSVAGLLVAGVLPGLMLAALFIGYAMIRIRLNPSLAPDSLEPSRKLPIASAILYCLPFLGLIALVLGLILMGVATPSESAAIGVTGSLMIAALFKRLSLALLKDALRSAALMTAMILIIMASSTLFSQLLAISGASRQITALVSALDLSPAMMVLAMMLIVFAFCMFVDQVAVMLIVIPIYLPVITLLQIDPLWFWMMMLLNVTVGGITPPFGYAMFAFRGAAEGVSMSELFRASWAFVGLFILGMLILAAAPWLATWLPGFV
ncbi:TRAP transporter large permease [Marivita sp. XM-24bin2]|jgi:tripartite ATP-independent transporter DctM subunit|uniref:TRAP transporter large permease n=1 Tax=unclassified Marivita TaxID=2632480 RepID=UPI000D792731|nr:TRAP transporter large permease [Marivita sp. XM-24bin2]MCR9110763.1 TRAP transporter large permease [Paracoccaceae bacterium]PWL33586.1 MAG: C4-dicarboxylate ABC transporter permease [Marivita sp. XM-24bin2]